VVRFHSRPRIATFSYVDGMHAQHIAAAQLTSTWRSMTRSLLFGCSQIHSQWQLGTKLPAFICTMANTDLVATTIRPLTHKYASTGK
jgi:hypothetical protein